MNLGDYLRLRRLVDVLYDVQDVRLRTANRLRQMPRKTAALYVEPLQRLEQDLTKEIDRLLRRVPIYTSFLRHVRGVGPRISGCIVAETMISFVRVPKAEYERARRALESQADDETQISVASRETDETQLRDAGRKAVETHCADASQRWYETQAHRASQLLHETHKAAASQNSNATQQEGVSRYESDAQERDASQDNPDPHNEYAFTREQLELAQKTEGGDYLVPALRGIAAFPTVSKYWAWWGLHVVDGRAPRRRRGQNINWSPKMRTLAWKIGKQFVMQGRRYRDIYLGYKRRLQRERPTPRDCPRYEECKKALKRREEPACRGHIEAMARRYAVKMFLSHLWEKWRRLEGLPVRGPYALERLGHTTKVEPEDASQKIGETQRDSASRGEYDPRGKDASQSTPETLEHGASHVAPENLDDHASRIAGETQSQDASRGEPTEASP